VGYISSAVRFQIPPVRHFNINFLISSTLTKYFASLPFALQGDCQVSAVARLVVSKDCKKSLFTERNTNVGTPKMSATKPAIIVKARLRNVGNGVLEVNDESVKFYVETGRFKKRREIVREIPIAEVEGVERQESDLSVTWKGNIEAFAIEQASQVETIHERITLALKKRQKSTEIKPTTVEETRNDLPQTITNAIEVGDSVFNLLQHLHGRVDWKLVENSYQQLEQAVGKLPSQLEDLASLDVNPLSLAIQARNPRETSEKCFDLLKTLYHYFDDESPSAVEGPEQVHPNRHEAKLVLHAFYILNDTALGAFVGEKTEEEDTELLKTLDEFSKLPDSKLNFDAVKASLGKLSEGKRKQREVFDETKLILRQQLKELIASGSGQLAKTH
jgi:hypothetical protein